MPYRLIDLAATMAAAFSVDEIFRVVVAHREAMSRARSTESLRRLVNDLVPFLHPVDIPEVAKILEVTESAATNKLKAGKLPPPIWRIEGDAVWSASQIISPGRKKRETVEITRPTLTPEGAFVAGRGKNAPQVSLVDVLAHYTQEGDTAGFDRTVTMVETLVGVTNDTSALRNIGLELSNLALPVGIEDVAMLTKASVDEVAASIGRELPSPWLSKSGLALWLRAQFEPEQESAAAIA